METIRWTIRTDSHDRILRIGVLKEDNTGEPLWWSEGGINWTWYGARSLDEARKLFKELTNSEPYDWTIQEEKDGTASFRIHR